MYVKSFIHKMLSPVMQKKRLSTLILLVNSLLMWKKLSVTELGRGINLEIQERSAIRRADRFIGNKKLHKELNNIYKKNIEMIVGNKKRPMFIVDWSQVPNTKHYILKVVLAAKGRAFTLYEEVHPERKLSNATIEKKFLATLSKFLPSGCKPIVISDAGFRNPWFKKVLELGWDYVGRIRGTQQYFDGKKWRPCRNLLLKASLIPQCLGKILLCKGKTIYTHLYLIKEKCKSEKWRKKYKKKRSNPKDMLSYSRSAKEPWLLASSLQGNSFIKIKRVNKIYKTRMQIEENFRDLKNQRYGFSLRNTYSRDRKRMQILLLIGMIASLIAMLVGYIAEKNEWHYYFQVPSKKTKRILSLFFLGCQVLRKKIKITAFMFEAAILEAGEDIS